MKMSKSFFKSGILLRKSWLTANRSWCAISSRTVSSENNGSISTKLFTEDHRQLQKTVRQIVDNDINPHVDEWEQTGQFPAHTVFKKLGQAGCLGITKPVEFGGMDLDYSYAAAVNEEFGEINCGAIPMAIGVQVEMATPALTRFGSDKLKAEFLAPTIAGELVSAIGVSESTAGSDVANIKTRAEKRGDDYIINGSKMWITNGYQADWICLLVNTSEGAFHQNKSMIVVPTDLPGLQRARRIDKLGMRSSDTAELFFDDVRVPQSYRIGKEGYGFTYQMMQFQEERMYAAAVAIRPMEKVLNETIAYTENRQAFGKPLLNNQVIHYRLAELKTELECYKSLVYRSVAGYAAGDDVTMMASMCKLKGGRLARELVDTCLQYWGGMGYTNEVLVSRMYRDLRLMSIGGGADEVMLGIICKYMGTLPKP